MTPLERLEAEAACRALVIGSAAAADDQDWQRLAGCYSVDATLVRPGGPELHGREAIRAAYASRDPDRLTEHLICNLLVTFETERCAQARCKVLLWSGRRSDPTSPRGRPADPLQQVGAFLDRVVLTDEGWRIARREASFRLYCETGPGAR